VLWGGRKKKGFKLILSSTLRELPMIADNHDIANAWKVAISDHIFYVKQKEEIFNEKETSVDVLVL
jgi:hypothetical protein